MKPSLRGKFQKAAGEAPVNDNLPCWNLGDLYSAPDSEALRADMAEAEERAATFADDYEGAIAFLSGAELADAIREYEEIETIRYRVSAYVGLLEAENLANFSKTEPLKKWQGDVGGTLSFFDNEIAEMPERDLMTKIGATPELARYASWIARLRGGTGGAVDETVENLSAEYSNTNREAWRRLYHESYNDIRVSLRGEALSIDAASEKAAGASSLPQRREIRAAIAAALKEKAPEFALIYNTIAKDRLIEMQLRGETRVDQQENAGNDIADAVVDTMQETVKDWYHRLSHRLYRWKAAAQGVPVLERAAVSLPLPDSPKTGLPACGFEAAKQLILKAFRKFSPVFARHAQKVFDDGHIDAAPRADKETGAFSMPAGPGVAPYIFMTYNNGIDDVVTLGHELGHAVHQTLAEKAQGLLCSDVSTPVAETASIFAEMLVFEEMLAQQKDPAVKKRLLTDKLEGMIQNGLQQLAFFDFEKQVHEARQNGALSVEEISDIWLATQREYFGPAVELDDYDRYYWMVVPHFYDTPFYVYSYAFAQVQVSGLYQAYKAAAAEGEEARQQFVQDYIALLETGTTRSLYDSLRPFGLDPETPEFWEKGLSLMEEYMDTLENMPAAPAQKTPAPAAAAARKPKRSA